MQVFFPISLSSGWSCSGPATDETVSHTPGNFLPSLAQRTKKRGASRSVMFLQFTIAKQSYIRAENEEVLNDPFRLKRGKFTNAEQKAGPGGRPCFVSCPGFLAKFIN